MQAGAFIAVRGILAVAGIAAAARVLAWMTPDAVVLVDQLRQPQATVDELGSDALALAGASIACWAALLWMLAALAVSLATALPGRGGRLARTVAAAALPVTVRRLLAVALGLAVVTSSGAAPALAADAPQARPSASPSLDLDWPVRAAPTPSPATRKPAVAASAARRGSHSIVVVQRGDTLWAIARRHLPPGASNADIAAAWPRWYAANRAVVGADPDLLLPGQRLVPPTKASGGSS